MLENFRPHHHLPHVLKEGKVQLRGVHDVFVKHHGLVDGVYTEQPGGRLQVLVLPESGEEDGEGLVLPVDLAVLKFLKDNLHPSIDHGAELAHKVKVLLEEQDAPT